MKKNILKIILVLSPSFSIYTSELEHTTTKSRHLQNIRQDKKNETLQTLQHHEELQHQESHREPEEIKPYKPTTWTSTLKAWAFRESPQQTQDRELREKLAAAQQRKDNFLKQETAIWSKNQANNSVGFLCVQRQIYIMHLQDLQTFKSQAIDNALVALLEQEIHITQTIIDGLTSRIAGVKVNPTSALASFTSDQRNSLITWSYLAQLDTLHIDNQGNLQINLDVTEITPETFYEITKDFLHTSEQEQLKAEIEKMNPGAFKSFVKNLINTVAQNFESFINRIPKASMDAVKNIKRMLLIQMPLLIAKGITKFTQTGSWTDAFVDLCHNVTTTIFDLIHRFILRPIRHAAHSTLQDTRLGTWLKRSELIDEFSVLPTANPREYVNNTVWPILNEPKTVNNQQVVRFDQQDRIFILEGILYKLTENYHRKSLDERKIIDEYHALLTELMLHPMTGLPPTTRERVYSWWNSVTTRVHEAAKAVGVVA